MCKKYCVERRLPQTQRNQFAIGSKGKYWKTGENIDVRFTSGSVGEHSWIMDILNEEITPHANVKYNQVNVGGDIRIGLQEGGGSWAYIGTDAAHIDPSLPTMNIGWKDDVGTVIHEGCHSLGLRHEHQHPKNPIPWNREVVIRDLSSPPNSWSLDEIEWNVFHLPNLSDVDLLPEIDPTSIMMYFFPKSWTLNNFETFQNEVLSAKDILLLKQLYPYAADPTPVVNTDSNGIALKILQYLLNDKKRGMRNLEVDMLTIQNMLSVEGGDKKLSKKDNLKLIQEGLLKLSE